MVLFGRMKECIILQKKSSSYIHKNLVLHSLGLAVVIGCLVTHLESSGIQNLLFKEKV